MTQIEITYEGNLKTRCVHLDSLEEITTDAPKDNGGEGELFSPTDLLAAALGSCVLTVMGLYAKRLNVDLKGAKIKVEKQMEQAPSRRIGKLTLAFTCPHAFPKETTEKLEKAALHCPVHASLHPDIAQEFTFQWGVL